MRARRMGLALAGLLAACGLGLSSGPALAQTQAQARLTPSPAEWWFAGWQVQQRVWPLTEGAGVTIAEVESGVQASVPDLRGVVLAGVNLTGGRARNGDTDLAAQYGHGTAMAAVIAGHGAGTGTVGIAPRARILPVIVADGSSRLTSLSTVADGIRYAASHGAQVIDMPFGSIVSSPAHCDPAMQAAIAYALERNVVLVASAGDSNLAAGPGEPASCAGVLAVGGIEPGGALWRYSTREPYVAVAAPADHMVYVERDGQYTTTGFGTSFSAALTAAAAALIRSRYPHMPWYEVDQRLIGTAHPVGATVPNDGYGYGIVDLAKAVNASAYPLSPAAPDPVYARFKAWLATPDGQAFTARYGSRPAARSSGVADVSARGPAASPSPRKAAGVTIEEIVIIAAGAVCVFVAVLIGVLKMSSRRRTSGRHARWQVPAAAPPIAPVPGDWERRAWSFGPEEQGAYEGAPGYGHPPGYGPPPLWTGPPSEPPAWR